MRRKSEQKGLFGPLTLSTVMILFGVLMAAGAIIGLVVSNGGLKSRMVANKTPPPIRAVHIKPDLTQVKKETVGETSKVMMSPAMLRQMSHLDERIASLEGQIRSLSKSNMDLAEKVDTSVLDNRLQALEDSLNSFTASIDKRIQQTEEQQKPENLPQMHELTQNERRLQPPPFKTQSPEDVAVRDKQIKAAQQKQEAEAAKQELMRYARARQEQARQEQVRQEQARQEQARQEQARQEQARQEKEALMAAAKRQAEQKEAAKREAALKLAAEKAEAAQREAEQKATALRKAAQKATALREAAQKAEAKSSLATTKLASKKPPLKRTETVMYDLSRPQDKDPHNIRKGWEPTVTYHAVPKTKLAKAVQKPRFTTASREITGSIKKPVSSKKVTRKAKPKVNTPFAVHIASATTLYQIKDSWLTLHRDNGILRGLTPHLVSAPAGKTAKVPWKLLAGPVTSEDEAARICTRLNAKGNFCRRTSLTGTPLKF